MSANSELQVPSDRRPRHIAIIMDGNGRWAERRNLPRIEGHRQGVSSARSTVEECARLGIEQLTLYCLSSENWKRPQNELDFLLHLLEQYMIEERASIMEHDIVVTIIGRRSGIPPRVLREMDKTIDMSASNHGTRLCLAINYGANRVRFVSAVPAGSKVRARIALHSLTPVDGGAQQATWNITVEREGSSKPCLVAEWLVRYYPDGAR